MERLILVLSLLLSTNAFAQFGTEGIVKFDSPVYGGRVLPAQDGGYITTGVNSGFTELHIRLLDRFGGLVEEFGDEGLVILSRDALELNYVVSPAEIYWDETDMRYYVMASGFGELSLSRLMPDGSLDNEFGVHFHDLGFSAGFDNSIMYSGGVFTLAGTIRKSGSSYAHIMQIDKLGQFVALGSTDFEVDRVNGIGQGGSGNFVISFGDDNNNVGIIKFSADLILDTNFGDRGVFSRQANDPFGTSALAVSSDDDVYFAKNGYVVKLDAMGALATGWGNEGIVTVGSTQFDLRLSSNDEVYVGYRDDEAESSAAIVKLDATGNVMTGFGREGIVEFGLRKPEHVEEMIVTDETVTVMVSSSGQNSFYVARIFSDSGELDR